MILTAACFLKPAPKDYSYNFSRLKITEPDLFEMIVISDLLLILTPINTTRRIDTLQQVTLLYFYVGGLVISV